MKAIYFLALFALLLAVSIQSAPAGHSLTQPSTAEGENQLAATAENENDTAVMRYKRHLEDIQERSKRSKKWKKFLKKNGKKLIKEIIFGQHSNAY